MKQETLRSRKKLPQGDTIKMDRTSPKYGEDAGFSSPKPDSCGKLSPANKLVRFIYVPFRSRQTHGLNRNKPMERRFFPHA